MTHTARRLVTGIIVLFAALSVLSVRSLAFSDVTDPNAFYYDAVNWASGEGIAAGYDDGTFRPMNGCNRAAVVTFLWRLGGRPEAQTAAEFTDMPGDPEFVSAISWAAEEGITTGWSDGTFRPWRTCNRAAIVTFLWRFAGRPEPQSTAGFTDMPEDPDFVKAVSWASENGITTGYEDGSFRPWQTCNRLAAVSFLYRFRFGDGHDGPYSGCSAVCFGDSNAEDAYAKYPLRGNMFRELRSLLHITEWANYGVSGSTFQTGGVHYGAALPVIMDQVTRAPSEGADAVDLVVLIGGINDFHYCPYDEASFAAAVGQTVSAVAAKYPNAQIVALFDGNSLLPGRRNLRYEAVMRQTVTGVSTARGSCMYVSLSDFCQQGRVGTESTFYESTNHYNGPGAHAAALRIAAALRGEGLGYVPAPEVTRTVYTEEAPSNAGAWGFTAVTVTSVDPAGSALADGRWVRLSFSDVITGG